MFKDLIKRDITRVFLNETEFCDSLLIQVRDQQFTISGSLQNNSIQNNSGNGGALQDLSWTLYTSYPIQDFVLSAGTRITIDNKPYTVVSLADELGIATIQLKAGVGR